MSFVPEKPLRWQLAAETDKFIDRNKHRIYEDTSLFVVPEYVDKSFNPRLRLDVFGSDFVTVWHVSGTDESGFCEIGLNLYKDGSPYVPDFDVARGIEFNDYNIHMGREFEPFVASMDEVYGNNHDGSPDSYIQQRLQRGEKIHFLDDMQCGILIGHLFEIEKFLP